MNKTLLIIICDFLLLSLLSLASFDKPAESQPPAPEQAEDQTTSRDDLMDALQTALEQEQQSREQLQSQLMETRDQAKTQEQLLAEREASLRALQQNLKLTEDQARLLDQERKALDEQVYASVRSIVDLEKQLTDASVQTQVSQARLDALAAELRMREREADRLQNQLSTVEERQRAAEAEKQQLAVKLEVTEKEKDMVREQLVVTREQVAVVQQEKQQIQQEKQQIQQEKAVIQEHAKVLAEGVSSLAEKSGELRQEIVENRPLTGNVILSSFFTNRVDAEFTAGRSGLLGQTGNSRSTKTVLVSSGGQVYALYHAQDTLLNIAAGATDWNYLFGNLRRGFALVSVESLSFLQADPRIILAPISADQAKELGVAVYPLAKEPFKFNEAVLVGGTEGYYGEAPFQLDPATPKHVRMQRERFSKLFGKFTPSRGDLVFSKTGEVLGIMANGEYCLVLDDLTVGGTVTLGATIQGENNKQVLANMGFRTSQLPVQVR